MEWKEIVLHEASNVEKSIELNRELKNRCIKTKKVSITRGVVLSEGKFHVS